VGFGLALTKPHRLKPVLPNTLPPEIDDDLQNHFLAGILAPMWDVVLQFPYKN
jgi:hypothetical protein